MTDDRKSAAMALHPNKAALPSLARFERCILAALCFLSSVFCPLAAADGISVNKAEVRLGEGGYQLSARYDIDLTFAAQQALMSGVPLYFVGEFLLTRSRWYWLDEDIFQGEQTVKLSYHALTRQYRLSRGTLFQNFASFEDAQSMLIRQSSAIIPPGLLNKGGDYMAAVRLHLDITQLPLPLQVNALTGKDWALDSGWYRWVVNPAEIAASDKGKAE